LISSGENVIIISPDSENLSILSAAVATDDPDASLPKHARFQFKNGEMRLLHPVIKPSELLVTGQTRAEADVVNRRMQAMRISGATKLLKSSKDDWFDLWHMSIDENNRL
jgi:hypothetical protein